MSKSTLLNVNLWALNGILYVIHLHVTYLTVECFCIRVGCCSDSKGLAHPIKMGQPLER